MIEDIKRKESEADFEYGLRLLTGKVEGLYDIDWQDIVDELGLNVHRDTLRKNFNKTDYCQEYGYSGYDVLQYCKDKQKEEDKNVRYRENISLNSDGTQVSDKLIRMSEEECKDVNFVLKAHGYDVKEWELLNAKNNIWNVYSKQDGVSTLYSSKITVKPRFDNISLEEIKEHFETFTNNYKPREVENLTINNSGKMLEIPIMDLHLGKLSWNLETGENYDYKIAEQRFFHAIDDIIQKTKGYQFEKILFPIGNDFVNFDNIDGNTTGGTKQDNDLRWQKVYLKAMEILVKAIETLSTIAPVEVFYIGGNHDKTTSFYLTCYLSGFFHKNDKVTVDLSPNIRKYIEFGKVLIGYTHGNLEKKRIGGIMQVEAREAWGRTVFHEFHLGHLHSEQTKEENGIIIRNISSITSGDAWHHESGYVGAIRKAQAFIWDKEYGLEGIINSVIV
ncbi:MAG: hypothetical protein PHP29_08370 [Tissierellia bacterium]|nr:hypothetical protein [Tissierellia bacterium]